METETPDGTINSTQQASIDQLDLITRLGVTPLKRFMVELSYHEDLYGFCSSGYVMLRDGVGLIENGRLTGDEYIEIKFAPAKGLETKTKKLRVYTIGKRKPTGNMTSEFYSLFFCSEELILSEQNKISQSYKGQKVSEIVKDILSNKMKVDTAKINKIENTTGVYDFIIPRLKPLEAISWVSNHARPESTGLVGADMLFFENRYGFNFSSLNTLMQAQPYKTYRYQQNNLGQKVQDLENKLTSIIKYEVVKDVNFLNSTASGLFANRLLLIDPLRKTSQVADFDYDKYTKKLTGLNKNPLPTDVTNRLGKKPNENYDAVYKVRFANLTQVNVPEIKNIDGSVGKDIFLEETLTHRAAQLSLANHTVLKLVVPGDSLLTVGSTLNLQFFTLLIGETRKLDEYYSGKYLITAVRHILQSQGAYQTVLEVAKESTTAPYQIKSK